MVRPEPFDVIIILVVALLLFGAKRLPETARSMGKAIREFRDAITMQDSPTRSNDPADNAVARDSQPDDH